MIYICPAFDQMPPEMQCLSRLYAFPRIPLPPPADGMVILDSGAFALAYRKQSMSPTYMTYLAAHYQKYQAARVYCIAPDVLFDATQTMRNFAFWQDQYPAVSIVPVIQFAARRQWDLYTAIKQAQYYARWQPQMLALSNPFARAVESPEVPHLCQLLRAILPNAWLHILGAGWDAADIRAWGKLGGYDSLDSIAYYTAAQAGDAWDRNTYPDWQTRAMANANYAQKILKELT